MNSKDLYNAIGKLDDDILEQSETEKKKKRSFFIIKFPFWPDMKMLKVFW